MKNKIIKKENGDAALYTVLILSFILILGSLFVTKSVGLSQKVASGTQHKVASFNAAEANVERMLAYIAKNKTFAGATTIPYPLDGHSFAYNLSANSAANEIVYNIRITANKTDRVGTTTSTVEQKAMPLVVTKGTFGAEPFVINGCMSKVTGSPTVDPGAPNVAIVSTQAASCINTGNLADASLTVKGKNPPLSPSKITGNGFTGTAWDNAFNIPKEMMKALSKTPENIALNAQNPKMGILYYDASNPFAGNWHDNVGDVDKNAILIFDTGAGCPKVNGSPKIYGIVYYNNKAGDCDTNGFGGATITGSLVIDGDINGLNANTAIIQTPTLKNINKFVIPVPLVKIAGSWRQLN